MNPHPATPHEGETRPNESDAPAPAAVASQPAKSSDMMEDVPDPDEDDLDDLDDLLDDFSTTNLNASKPTGSSGSGPSTRKAKETQGSPHKNMDGEQLTRELEAGLAGMIDVLQKDPEMQEAFEVMLGQMMAAHQEGPEQLHQVMEQIKTEEQEELRAAVGPQPAESAEPSSSTKPAPASASADASFQDTIRRTMERMQTSGDQATAAAASEGGTDDFAEVIRQLSEGTFGEEGSDEDFSKLIMGMMDQLTTKEMLYEPLKELHDGFPAWLDKNRGSAKPEDVKRYEEHQRLVGEIVARFEQSSYSDASDEDRKYLVERISKMQEAGPPPKDLMERLASAPEGFEVTDRTCNPQ